MYSLSFRLRVPCDALLLVLFNYLILFAHIFLPNRPCFPDLLPAMFQNILFGYSETLAGDTPDPGKGRKASAVAETCTLRTCLRHGFSQAQPVPVFPPNDHSLQWALLFFRGGIRIHYTSFPGFLLHLQLTSQPPATTMGNKRNVQKGDPAMNYFTCDACHYIFR